MPPGLTMSKFVIRLLTCFLLVKHRPILPKIDHAGCPIKSCHFGMQISRRIISQSIRNLKVGKARKISFLPRRVLSGSYVGARERFSPDTILAFHFSPSPRSPPSPRENDVLLLIYLRCCSFFVSS